MEERTIHEDAAATLTRLKAKHPDLRGQLRKAHGFAVFPAIGRASAVLGTSYGHGEVYQRGKPIGFCTVSQITVGVQVGGQTFSELVIFKDTRTLEEFKGGKVAFNANASAVLVKAAASGTTNYDDVEAHAYARGGMLLELSLGGQKFSFQPPSRGREDKEQRSSRGRDHEERASRKREQEAQQAAEGERSAGPSARRGRPRAVPSRIARTVKAHPVATSALGLGLTAAAALLTAGRPPVEEAVEQ